MNQEIVQTKFDPTVLNDSAELLQKMAFYLEAFNA